jgi:RNA recognition motif-containing protein
VYVAGLPKRATEDTLRKSFSRFGSIKSVTIIRDHETNQSRRFAYVLYSEEEAAAQAIKELDQTTPFNDWRIKVELARRTYNKDQVGGHS